MPSLYILPSLLSHEGVDHIPDAVRLRIAELRVFIVERTRTARRFIRAILPDYPIDDATFYELDKHDMLASQAMIHKVIDNKTDVGLISEAGTPCIADPGAMVVHIARKADYNIRPLAGPSSILLALMASGMNGQEFSFHGYLPIKEPALSHKLSQMSVLALTGATQIFMETPYRNDKLLQQISKTIDPKLTLSISIDLTSVNEEHIITKPQQAHQLSIGKRPAIYCIGKLQ